MAYLLVEGRYIFYLVTKKRFYEKPSYRCIFNSLRKLRDFINENDIYDLAVPKLACGRDRKNWKLIKAMTSFLFRSSKCHLHFYG